MKKRKIFYSSLSKNGSKSPKNEDNYVLPESNSKFNIKTPNTKAKGHLFVLCDGMGGANAGEVASELASSWLMKEFYQADVIDNYEAWFRKNIKQINSKLLKLSRENEEYSGMGTTLVSLLIKDNKAYIANVGDSRLYLFDLHNNKFKQITDDHSEVWELYKQGHIKKDEIINNRRKHILTQALGTEEEVSVNTYHLELPSKYMFLLCSDGLTDVAIDKIILDTIEQSASLDDTTKKLYELSQKNKSKDDVTITVVTNLNKKSYSRAVKKSYSKIKKVLDKKTDDAAEVEMKTKTGVKKKKVSTRTIVFGFIFILLLVVAIYFITRSREKIKNEDVNDSTASYQSGIVDTMQDIITPEDSVDSIDSDK